MSFQSPWLLLALPLLAVPVGLWLLAERRRITVPFVRSVVERQT